jgi:hypothetical protein
MVQSIKMTIRETSTILTIVLILSPILLSFDLNRAIWLNEFNSLTGNCLRKPIVMQAIPPPPRQVCPSQGAEQKGTKRGN